MESKTLSLSIKGKKSYPDSKSVGCSCLCEILSVIFSNNLQEVSHGGRQISFISYVNDGWVKLFQKHKLKNSKKFPFMVKGALPENGHFGVKILLENPN